MVSKPGGMEMPGALRDAAEANLTQARRAFDEAMTAAHRAVDAVGGNANAMQGGARDAGRLMLDYTGDVVEDAFDYLTGLMKANDPAAFMKLQQDFLKRQMDKAGERARRMSEAAMKAGAGFGFGKM